MAAYSKRANASLIRRAEYDRHYRQAVAPTDDIERCVNVLTLNISTPCTRMGAGVSIWRRWAQNFRHLPWTYSDGATMRVGCR